MANGCYETSCWCAPIRWFSQCCSPPSSPTLHPITQVAVNAIREQNASPEHPITQVVVNTIREQNANPEHRRERTWYISSNGRMTYNIPPSVVRKEGE